MTLRDLFQERLWYGLTMPLGFREVLSLPWYLALRFKATHSLRTTMSLPCKVVSVGNIVVGGTGKTPFTMWLSKTLQRHGLRVSVVARSFGTVSSATCCVETALFPDQAVGCFGDEAVMMSSLLQNVPVWVSNRKWYAAIMAYINSKPDVIVIDDGFQHHKIMKNIEYVLFDATDLWGNGTLLPFGPLREPLSSLTRAHAIVITGTEDNQLNNAEQAIRSRLQWTKSIIKARRILYGIRLAGQNIQPNSLRSVPVCCFTAIARPYRLFRMLSDWGINVRSTVIFPDHYRFTDADMIELIRQCRKSGAELLVCSEKDYYKVPSQWKRFVGMVLMKLEPIGLQGVVKEYIVEPIVHSLWSP